VDVELIGAGGLDGGDHDGQVLGLAARHHGVDRDLLDAAFHQIRRHDRDDFLRRARRALEHREHARLGRGHDGQTVGPALRERRFHLVFERSELDAPRVQLAARELHSQRVHAIGVDGERAAAW
jgi:hypothetical protein